MKDEVVTTKYRGRLDTKTRKLLTLHNIWEKRDATCMKSFRIGIEINGLF